MVQFSHNLKHKKYAKCLFVTQGNFSRVFAVIDQVNHKRVVLHVKRWRDDVMVSKVRWSRLIFLIIMGWNVNQSDSACDQSGCNHLDIQLLRIGTAINHVSVASMQSAFMSKVKFRYLSDWNWQHKKISSAAEWTWASARMRDFYVKLFVKSILL